jgi:hypothetical protein
VCDLSPLQYISQYWEDLFTTPTINTFSTGQYDDRMFGLLLDSLLDSGNLIFPP